jgi:hypothetical protein
VVIFLFIALAVVVIGLGELGGRRSSNPSLRIGAYCLGAAFGLIALSLIFTG